MIERLRRRHHTEQDRGAVAVVFGVLCVVLFAVSALAVDLGNAWARQRAVQKQVDVSALSVGNLLPATLENRAAIADAVAARLNDADNQAVGSATVTGAQLLDGDHGNGQILFRNPDDSLCELNDTEDRCLRMEVIAPPAWVDFGLANVIGENGTTVRAAATVEVQSALPDPSKTLPFWLPNGCGYGPAIGDVGGGAPISSEPAPTATASADPAAGPVEPRGTHWLSGGPSGHYSAAVNSTITLSGLTISMTPEDFNKNDQASIRLYRPPDYRTYIDFAVSDADKLTNPLNVPPFQVTSTVTGTPGLWEIRALIVPHGRDEPSISTDASARYLQVGPEATPTAAPTTAGPTADPSASPSSVPVGCYARERGNFGQLESPRRGVSPIQQALAPNIALGLDHQLVPFEGATSNNCGRHYPIPGGVFDQADGAGNPVNGANCITGDTGNDGPKMYEGFVAGLSDGTRGRLDADVPGRETSPLCSSRSNMTVGSHSINNDVLSCFLRNGAHVDDLSQPTSASNTVDMQRARLDPRVMDSPRFVWLPVVYANDRAEKDFQPILDFVAGFITDETQSTAATSANGLTISGQKLTELRIYIFNKDALPPESTQDTTEYTDAIGQPVVRLVG